MAYTLALLIISLWVSSIEVSGNLPSLDMLNIPPPKPAKKTTTTPPPAPDPILTGAAARTAQDRVALELPDIVFADNQPGGSAMDLGTVANDINLDLDRLIKETLGEAPMGEHNAPRQTDLTALLDLINTDPIGRPDPTPFFDLPMPTATPKPPKPTLPQLGTLVSTSNIDSSVGIPVSKQETAHSSNKRISQTVKIPDLDFPSLPNLPKISDAFNSPPAAPELPSLSETSGGLPPLTDAFASDGLPPLSSGGFPSFTESSAGSPPFNDNSDSFSSFADTRRGFPSLPPIPDEANNMPPQSRIPGRPQSFPDPSEPIFNPDPRFQPAFQPQGLPRSPFTSRLPTDPRTSDLGEVGRLRNPFAPASQPTRRQGLSRAGRLPSRESLSRVLSEEQLQSNDPNLLPFAENVLSQVQQLVNRLKDNRDTSPASERAPGRVPVSNSDCPNGPPACPEDPCQTSSCLNIINAQCRPSCTECAPRYFVNGRDVTDTCTIISGLRSSGVANIAPSESGAHLFIGSNGDFLNIPRGGRTTPTRSTPQIGMPPRRPPIIDPITRQPIDPRFLEQIDPRRVMDPRMEQRLAELRAQQQQLPPGVDPRNIDPRMEQQIAEMRGQQQQLPPGVGPQNMDPRFLRALLENENIARMRNRPTGPPFDPRIGQFMRPGAPPVSFQQMARLRGQNLDVDAVRRFMAEQGLSGTANVGESEAPQRGAPNVPNQSLINRINDMRNRGLPLGMINQALQNGRFRGAQAPQASLPGNQAAAQRPPLGVNAQQLQALRNEFASFQTGQPQMAGDNPAQNSANQAPNAPSLSIQSAQNNPLATIQAARRALQRQAVRNRANVI
uniref:Uncharacterized protein n=1 Tax=Magallana gigas TaxID=29159 RepID=A0A8W8P494_MAGGI